jgi:flavin-dependent dehydrogenase
MNAATDVLIAGAGPAGCAAAIACARRGLEVLLLDRARFPRDKACGEGLLPSGVGALAELGLLAAVRRESTRLGGVGFQLDEINGVVVEAAFSDADGLPPFGLGVRRVTFDALLLQAARAYPTVTVLEGVDAHGPLYVNDRVVGLETSVGAIRARVVVAADGLRSKLRTALGLAKRPRPHERARVGLRVHLRVASLPFGSRVRVLIGPRLEHYLTPIGPHELQVAVLGTRGDFAAHKLSATTLDDHLGRHRMLGPLLDGAAFLDRPLGAGPFHQRVRSVVTDGALLVGDAAGYVDAITGEGIGAALRQGLAAGNTLALALTSAPRRAPITAAVLAPYARAHAAITRDSDRLTKIILFLARHHGLARRAVQSLARQPALFERLLRVQAGTPLSSLPLGDWARLVAG